MNWYFCTSYFAQLNVSGYFICIQLFPMNELIFWPVPLFTSAVKLRPKEDQVYFEVTAITDPVTRDAQRLSPFLLVSHIGYVTLKFSLSVLPCPSVFITLSFPSITETIIIRNFCIMCRLMLNLKEKSFENTQPSSALAFTVSIKLGWSWLFCNSSQGEYGSGQGIGKMSICFNVKSFCVCQQSQWFQL